MPLISSWSPTAVVGSPATETKLPRRHAGGVSGDARRESWSELSFMVAGLGVTEERGRERDEDGEGVREAVEGW